MRLVCCLMALVIALPAGAQTQPTVNRFGDGNAVGAPSAKFLKVPEAPGAEPQMRRLAVPGAAPSATAPSTAPGDDTPENRRAAAERLIDSPAMAARLSPDGMAQLMVALADQGPGADRALTAQYRASFEMAQPMIREMLLSQITARMSLAEIEKMAAYVRTDEGKRAVGGMHSRVGSAEFAGSAEGQAALGQLKNLLGQMP